MKEKSNRDFLRNVIALMTGTTVAQAIPIAISPLLTRMYTPAEFGVFSLFLAITSVVGVIANGCYEQAIMLPEDDDDALNLTAVGLLINVLIAFLLLLIVLFFNHNIASALGNPDIAVWLFLTPLSILLIGFNNLLIGFNSRKKNFSDIAKSGVFKSIIQSIIQVVAGFFHTGVGGLVLGQIISWGSSNTQLFRNTLRDKDLKKAVNFSQMKLNASRYSDFPKYSMLGVLANSLSINIGSFLIARFFSVSILGHYALVHRTMTVPANLISKSVAQVFYEQAARERRRNGNAIKVFISTFKKLFLLSICIFSVAFFVVEDVFAFVFGESWRVAGIYAQIMTPLFAIRFVVSPLSVINQLMLKNKVTMVVNFSLLIISVSVFVSSDIFSLDFNNTLKVLSLSLSVFYLSFFVMLFYDVINDKGESDVSKT